MRASVSSTREPMKPESRPSSEQGLDSAVNLTGKRFIRLTTGDRVKLQMSPYDLQKARIVYRLG